MTSLVCHPRQSAVTFAALFSVVLLAPGPAPALDADSEAAPKPHRVAASPHGERAVAQLAKGKFLVASRSLVDPNFAETVILLVDYDREGALGVVVNRPSDVALIEALPEVNELRKRKDVVFLGGPVARDRMLLLVRTRQQPPQSLRVFDRTDALVGRERYRDAPAHLRQLVEGGHRLLDVLEVVARQVPDHGDRGVDVPRAVGIDA